MIAMCSALTCSFAFTTQMLRKFLMSAVIVFIYNGSPQQTAAGMLITIVFLVGFVSIKPYKSVYLQAMQEYALAAQASTLFYGLMLNIES